MTVLFGQELVRRYRHSSTPPHDREVLGLIIVLLTSRSGPEQSACRWSRHCTIYSLDKLRVGGRREVGLACDPGWPL